ncbi:hypothetical protein BO71DRAFT_346763 [Aspergillus ellipticus CBS 707.79]|uniref:F-box domain-containing protein n=1 Tax=Aspergillus ellipticus CBS 707.79 TaxID=1448320 RepID=A0A319DJR9_9EURO|nr:hypothetical protein BO71DRAFT_346763 [Aspergillus ellipticus CBS 707.79]
MEPSCRICGCYIPIYSSLHSISLSHVFYWKRRRWRFWKRREGPFYYSPDHDLLSSSATAVDPFDLNMFNIGDNGWLTLFRAIVYSPYDNKVFPQGYHLSGIGYLPGAYVHDRVYVPIDPDSAWLGFLRGHYATVCARLIPPSHSKCKFRLSSIPNLFECMLLHSRCWDVVQRMSGPGGVVDLEHLIKRFECLPPHGSLPLPPLNPTLPDPKMFPDTLQDHHEYLRLYYKDIGYLPSVREALVESAQLARAQKKSQRQIFRNKFNIPIEIIYDVCEFLDLGDIQRMLLAFEERFPITYWEKYVPMHLIFEAEGLEMDSCSLAEFAGRYHSEEMITERLAILNRRRVVSICEFLQAG